MFEVMGSRGVEWGRPVGQQVPASMPGAGGSLDGLGCPGWPVSRLSVFGRAVRHCTMLLCGKRCGNWPAVFRFKSFAFEPGVGQGAGEARLVEYKRLAVEEIGGIEGPLAPPPRRLELNVCSMFRLEAS